MPAIGSPSRFLISLVLLILGGWVGHLWSRPAWSQQIYQTPRVSIHYQRPSDLPDMERRLRFTPAENLPREARFSSGPDDSGRLPGLTAKIEGLLNKVCLILKARPNQASRLRIFLLADGKQVKQRQLLFQPPGQARSFPFFGYGRLEAFYETRSRTIFLSLADLHEGILAHEMAHYVLCEAFANQGPQEVSEAWAKYVEDNLP